MKSTPVKGTADYLPSQALLRDYLQHMFDDVDHREKIQVRFIGNRAPLAPDIRELMDLNRDRMGLNSIGEKLEEIRLAAEAALAAERAERQAWMEQYGKNR